MGEQRNSLFNVLQEILESDTSRVRFVGQPEASFSWFCKKQNSNVDFLAGNILLMCHFEEDVTVSESLALLKVSLSVIICLLMLFLPQDIFMVQCIQER